MVMKILTVVGARPQFIKAAVVSRAIAEYNRGASQSKRIDEIIIHTGQHYDDNMSEVFFRQMQIPVPGYHLGLGGSSHGAMTGRMLEALENVLLKEKPDLTIVYGDTNSTLAAALAAAKVNIPVAHVEAGLRSFNMRMPEEINRILTDRISRWLFCPTETAVGNLMQEGASTWPDAKIELIGDVMFDAALFYRNHEDAGANVKDMINEFKDGFYLATAHRQENNNDPNRLQNIITALDKIAANIPIVFPQHPGTRKQMQSVGLNPKNIIFIEPVGYLDMIYLLDTCKAVFTDSGGLQKEACFFRKPCITLRDETEWVELVENGYNVLVGADIDKILAAEQEFVHSDHKFTVSLYGNGNAGEKIVKSLLSYFA